MRNKIYIASLLSMCLLAGCVRNIDPVDSSLVETREPFRLQTRGDSYPKQELKYDLVSVKDLHVDKTEVEACIGGLANMSAGTIEISLPSKIDKLYDYVMALSPRQSNKEFYQSFRNMIEYIYPGHKWDDDCLYYDGRQKKFFENYDNLMKEKTSVALLYYENTKNPDDMAHGTFTSPIGNDLGHFCRGVGKTYLNYGGPLETYGLSALNVEYVAKEKPDSTATYHLIDGDVRICDAVAFYEEYLKSIPGASKEGVSSTCVVSVDVLLLSEKTETYGLYFYTAPEIFGCQLDSVVANFVQTNKATSYATFLL